MSDPATWKVEKPGGMSSESVEKATGRGWAEWIGLLDGDEATKLSHPDIATLLQQKYGVPDWWCQMITVGYEQAHGMRVKGQAVDGFQVSLGKTVNVPQARLWAAFAIEAERAKWDPEGKIAVSKATEPKSIRLRWKADGTHISADCYSKGAAKSNVSLQHTKLPDAATADEMRTWWKEALERLVKSLE